MRANELMIGDWVCCINGDYHYPKAPKGRMNISGYGSGNPCKILRLEKVAVVEHKGEKIAEYGSLQPIPLTAEILTKNGFQVSANGTSIAYFSEEGEPLFTISIRKSGYWIPISWYGKGSTFMSTNSSTHFVSAD